MRAALVAAAQRVARGARIAAALAFALGCGRGDVAPAGRPPAEPAAALIVEDRPVAEVMRELSRVSGLPIVVDASAADVAACVNVSVIAAQPAPRSQLLRLVALALEPTPLSVHASADGWVVRRRSGVPLPERCGALALREDPLAALADFARPSREGAQALGEAGGEGLGVADVAGGAEGGGAEGGAAPARPGDEAVAAVIAGIAATGPDTYTVTRSAADALLGDGALLMRQVRVVPHLVEGQARGMKLYGIRRASVFGALGFENGDTLVTVNGFPVADPQLALEAYANVRHASELRVRVERRGEERTLTYRIVPGDGGRSAGASGAGASGVGARGGDAGGASGGGVGGGGARRPPARR